MTHVIQVDRVQTRIYGGVQPMSKEQARFWQLRKARPDGWWTKRTTQGASQ